MGRAGREGHGGSNIQGDPRAGQGVLEFAGPAWGHLFGRCGDIRGWKRGMIQEGCLKEPNCWPLSARQRWSRPASTLRTHLPTSACLPLLCPPEKRCLTGVSSKQPLGLSYKEHSDSAERLGLPCPGTYQLVWSCRVFGEKVTILAEAELEVGGQQAGEGGRGMNTGGES